MKIAVVRLVVEGSEEHVDFLEDGRIVGSLSGDVLIQEEEHEEAGGVGEALLHFVYASRDVFVGHLVFDLHTVQEMHDLHQHVIQPLFCTRLQLPILLPSDSKRQEILQVEALVFHCRFKIYLCDPDEFLSQLLLTLQ